MIKKCINLFTCPQNISSIINTQIKFLYLTFLDLDLLKLCSGQAFFRAIQSPHFVSTKWFKVTNDWKRYQKATFWQNKLRGLLCNWCWWHLCGRPSTSFLLFLCKFFFNSVFSWPWRVFHFFVDSGCSPWLGSNSVYDIQDFSLYMYFNFWLMTLFLTYFDIWERFSSSFSV